MSETTTTERTAEQTTAQVPQPAPVSEVKQPEAPKAAQGTATRPRVPRAHCAC